MATRWRFGRDWSEAELQAALAALRDERPSFQEQPDLMTPEHGWTVDGDEQALGHESPGLPLPDGPFARAKRAMVNYEFSDPRIVRGHFDRQAPLLGRDMLLEARVLGLRFLYACRVAEVRDAADDRRTTFGWRYETLTGHVEDGYEWFLLTKHHQSGEVRFRIEAHWRLSRQQPWWARLGFLMVGQQYRARFSRQAFRRLRRLVHRPGRSPK
jgi:uncharacterized protein (UPF0548 family)